MPIDATHVGRTYPPTPPHTVTRQEIDAFAQALGSAPAGEAPTTFAMRLAAPAWQAMFDDAELGLALHRTVHADQAFDVVRPLVAGDVATARLRIHQVRPRGQADLVTVVVEVRAGDDLVTTSTSTFLCTRAAA